MIFNSRKFFRRYKVFIGVGFLLVVVAVVGIGVYLGTFKDRVEDRLSSIFGQEIKIGQLKTNFPFNVALKNVDMSFTQEDSSFFKARNIILKYNPKDVFWGRYAKVNVMYIDSPVLRLSDEDNPLARSKGFKSGFKRNIQLGIEDGAVVFGENLSLIKELSGSLKISPGRLEFVGVRAKLFSMPVTIRGVIDNILDEPRFDVNINSTSNNLNYALNIKGALSSSQISGWISFFGRPKLDIFGTVIAKKDSLNIERLTIGDLYEINLRSDIGSYDVAIEVTSLKQDSGIHFKRRFDLSENSLFEHRYLSEDGAGGGNSKRQFSISLILNHLNVYEYDLFTKLYIFGHLLRNREKGILDSLKGTIITNNTLVDFIPMGELDINFAYQDGVLKITRFRFGDSLNMNGTIALKIPMNVDIETEVSDLDLDSLVMFAPQRFREKVSGEVSGKMTIKGDIPNPRIQGRFFAEDGNFGSVKYNRATANVEGEGLQLRIIDSQVVKEEGYLMLDGYLDLRKIGKPRFLEGVRLRSDEKTIVWRGWNVMKDANEEELELKKDVGDDFRINFKKFMNDEVYAQDSHDDEYELEYKFRENKSIKMRLNQYGEETVELEHRIKF